LKGLPGLCRKCSKSYKPNVHDKCRFCRDIGFKEEILCDLNRSVQSSKDLECHAYMPALELVPNVGALSDDEKDEGLTDGIEELLNSDRFKYRRTLAVQRLRRDPDAVLVNCKYHLAWSVTARMPVFADSGNTPDVLDKAFLAVSEFVGGFASLLWLAPDHLHIYVESNGNRSVEAIVQKLKSVSAKALHKVTGVQGAQFKVDREIWDRTYFAETLG
jgi:REP element-mobilizing transposase RayT